jgi:hypothetical protein
MNRRRLVIGIIGVIVFAAVLILIGVVWQSPPAGAITVRFHSFSTNGTQRVAFGVVSNTTTKDFVVNVSIEYMTNGAFPKIPVLMQPNEAWGGREHGLDSKDLAHGSNRCRFVVQYRRAPMTYLGMMFERLRTRLLGPRRIDYGYSDEFQSPP